MSLTASGTSSAAITASGATAPLPTRVRLRAISATAELTSAGGVADLAVLEICRAVVLIASFAAAFEGAT